MRYCNANTCFFPGKTAKLTSLGDVGHQNEETRSSEVFSNSQLDLVSEENCNFSETYEPMMERVLENHEISTINNGEELSPQQVQSPFCEDSLKDHAQGSVAQNTNLTSTTGVKDGNMSTERTVVGELLEIKSEVEEGIELSDTSPTAHGTVFDDSSIGIVKGDAATCSEGSDVEAEKDAILEPIELAKAQSDHREDESFSPETLIQLNDFMDLEKLKQEESIEFTTLTSVCLEEEERNLSIGAIDGPSHHEKMSAFVDAPALKVAQLDTSLAGALGAPTMIDFVDEPIALQLDGCLGISFTIDKNKSSECCLSSEAVMAEIDAGPPKESETIIRQLKGDISDDNHAHRTRSGARFSDDTNMLKDFISRAQARKAAKSTEKPTELEVVPSAPNSPRKILGQLDSNCTKPVTFDDPLKRPGTPPEQPKTDELEADDKEEASAGSISYRRSTRKRLPGPGKTPTSAPSFIPVRRADGTDPVVLQKSVTHELTVITRANTRRNKGQSKMPKLVLQDLSPPGPEVAEATKRPGEGVKVVSWDERLVHYQEAGEKEGKEAKKIRRLRGLEGTNGTPARKRVRTDTTKATGRQLR